jgi:DNA-binding MarR family transcriptional regulator
MNPKDIRTLDLLEKVHDDDTTSQRDLARDLNISLGLVNSFVKQLAKKGYFKVTHVPKNRIRYILTPKGIAEKSRLTYERIQYSYKFYKAARKKLRNLYTELEKRGISRIVFYGVSELTEIAYVSLLETNIKLAAVVDEGRAGRKFLHLTVERPAQLEFLLFDIILITSIGSTDPILNRICKLGISLENVVQVG